MSLGEWVESMILGAGRADGQKGVALFSRGLANCTGGEQGERVLLCHSSPILIMLFL
jgi:hypothetical protein